MFDIHLAWSPLMFLVAVVLLLVASAGTVVLKFKKNPRTKLYATAITVLAVIIGLSAFDVGTRQADLNRGRFDALPNEKVVDKVESRQQNAATVQQQFKQVVDQKTKTTKEELK